MWHVQLLESEQIVTSPSTETRTLQTGKDIDKTREITLISLKFLMYFEAFGSSYNLGAYKWHPNGTGLELIWYRLTEEVLLRNIMWLHPGVYIFPLSFHIYKGNHIKL